jgi:small subunit ribosomal protein S18
MSFGGSGGGGAGGGGFGGGGGGGFRGRGRGAKAIRKKPKARAKVKKKDPIYIDGVRPRPLYVDYKDLELLGKLVNRQAKIIGRRKSGCTAASQHAVTRALKQARFMALLPFVGD